MTDGIFQSFEHLLTQETFDFDMQRYDLLIYGLRQLDVDLYVTIIKNESCAFPQHTPPIFDERAFYGVVVAVFGGH